MKSIDEKLQNFDGLVEDAKKRTDDPILIGYIDLLSQHNRALIEENENLNHIISDLKEIIARDASKKFGTSSERLKDAAGKGEGDSGSGSGSAQAEGAAPSPAEASEASGTSEASREETSEEIEARRKKLEELRKQIKELDRQDAELRARQAASVQPGGVECKDLESGVPEEERFCKTCGARLSRLRWREAHRLALKRIRLIRLKVRVERVYCPDCARRARIQRRIGEKGPGGAGGASPEIGGQATSAGHGSGCACAACAAAASGGEGKDAAGTPATAEREDAGKQAASGSSGCACAACAAAASGGEEKDAAVAPAQAECKGAGGLASSGTPGCGGTASADGSPAGGEAESGKPAQAGIPQPGLEEEARFAVTEADSLAVIPHCPATASMLAYFAAAKFEDAIPLARLQKMFARVGISAPRQTLSHWIAGIGGLLAPFVSFMHGWLASSEIVNADETPIRVHGAEGVPDTSKKYLWVFFGHGGQGPKVFYCVYAPTRSSAVPMDVLADLKDAFLQTDGYAGYGAVKSLEGVTGVSCLAHARRKFREVLDTVQEKQDLPDEDLAKASAAMGILKGIAAVYAREKEIKERELPPDETVKAREEEIRPMLEALRREIEETQKSTPKSVLLGRACTYALGQWEGILAYMGHADLTLDNNYLESVGIRPATIGRKNFLFFKSENGARAGAVLYSVILTAKANGLNPEQYLMTLLMRFGKTPPSRWAELLPWNISKLEPFPEDKY